MSVTFLQAANNVSMRLAEAIDGVTDPITFDVQSGEGTQCPTIPFPLTIGGEILKCTSRVDDTLTCDRAQEDTLISSHDILSLATINVTAAYLTEIQEAINDILSGDLPVEFPASIEALLIQHYDAPAYLDMVSHSNDTSYHTVRRYYAASGGVETPGNITDGIILDAENVYARVKNSWRNAFQQRVIANSPTDGGSGRCPVDVNWYRSYDGAAWSLSDQWLKTGQRVQYHASSEAAETVELSTYRAYGNLQTPVGIGDTDILWRHTVYGHDNTNYVLGAIQEFFVDGTPGTNDMPTGYRIKLSPNSTATPETVFEFTNGGDLDLPFSVSIGETLDVTGNVTLDTITAGTWNGSYIDVTYGGTGAGDSSTARYNLGLEIGVNVQAYNAILAAIAAGTWTGAASITTLGTIGTGSWHGSTITADHGGTGQAVYAVGDLLYASTTTALSRLADVAVGSVLCSGGANTAPAWSASPTLTSLYLANIYGGAAANDDITIRGTSHATKTTSYVLLQPDGGYVGIGTTVPTHLFQSSTANTNTNSVVDYLISLRRTDAAHDATNFGTGISWRDHNSMQASIETCRINSALTYRSDLVFKVNITNSSTVSESILAEVMRLDNTGQILFGGGYGSTGTTITSAGVITSNGAATFDGLVTCGDKLKVVANGTDLLPSIYWGTDTNTGLYHAENQILITANGSLVALFSADGLSLSDRLFLGEDGSEATPTVYWGLDSDTGFYHSANIIGIACGGDTITKFKFDSVPMVGFLGADPVAQNVHIANATNATDVITRVNAILVVLENLGFVATS